MDLQMGIPLLQQMSETCGHGPHCCLHLLWVHVTRLQLLQVQYIVLTVSQLENNFGKRLLHLQTGMDTEA